MFLNGPDPALRRSLGAVAVFLCLAAGQPTTVGRPVPPVRQGLNLCGPASLATIAGILGLDGYDQRRIAREMLHLPAAYDWRQFPGTDAADITAYLQHHRQLQGTWHHRQTPVDATAAVRQAVQRGHAVLLAIDVDSRSADFLPGVVSPDEDGNPIVGHWIVIRGYDPAARDFQVYDVLSRRFDYTLPAVALGKQWSLDRPGDYVLCEIGRR